MATVERRSITLSQLGGTIGVAITLAGTFYGIGLYDGRNELATRMAVVEESLDNHEVGTHASALPRSEFLLEQRNMMVLIQANQVSIREILDRMR